MATITNPNIQVLAHIISDTTGINLTCEHIHANTEGRSYYTQAPKRMAPMLLHHYRGPFFIDMHPDDIRAIVEGEISAQGYVDSANWQIGYYWGGGSMVSGGYYQPLDIHDERLPRYLQILACRGTSYASHYMPDADKCGNCPYVNDCPFSAYSPRHDDWSKEIPEYDPRVDFFQALARKFERRFGPEYKLHGFSCGNLVGKDEAWLFDNPHFVEGPFELRVSVNDEVIRDLLMREVKPEDWDEYAKRFKFLVYSADAPGKTLPLTNENLEKVFKDHDVAKKSVETKPTQPKPVESSWLTRFWDSFKGLFSK